MWQKKVINDIVYVVRQSDDFTVSVIDGAEDHPLFQEYLQWVAEGNQVEEETDGN